MIRPFARKASTLVVMAIAVTTSSLPAQQRVDLLIRGGTLVDGTGTGRRPADVGVRGGSIAFVGDARAAGITAARTIDATGLVVAPGFIDPHTHTFGDLTSNREDRRRNAAYLMQGVTTVITGNDGGGPLDVGAQLARMKTLGIGTNAALYVGFGTIRSAVLGAGSGAPDDAQLARMREMVAQGMEGGALGLSTGLYYAPQSYSTTEEVIALAKEAGSRGGIYDSHLRDESSYSIGLLGAVREALRIGREGGLPVHISHIKALGLDVWGQSDSVIAIIRAAQAAGQVVTADQYPYTASGTAVGASLLPRWAQAGGRDSLRQRAADPATRTRLLADMRENLRRRGGPHALLITDAGRPALTGKRLDEIAAARQLEPVVAALEVVLEGDASVASFNMNEDDIANFMKQPWVFTGSDGSDGHPRKYGTFPRKLRAYVFGKHVLSLEEMVKRSSGDVAQALGLPGRGTIAAGAAADLIVFDSMTVAEQSTYEAPDRLAVGMQWVVVNGVVAVDAGKPTTAMAGQALARGRR
jgi:N-acyl-D-amino-acid deacylase